MKTTTEITCPRCLGAIPSILAPGMYIGALSRADNKTEICSACGEEEAMDDFNKETIMFPQSWPVTQYLTERFSEARERCSMWYLKIQDA